MIVWDLPLRVFHWSFMACVIGAIATGKMENYMLHERFGLAIMGLVSFRIIWGFIGSHTARFANFLAGPRAFLASAKALRQKQVSDKAGHNPTGGFATLALLAIPLMMTLTGSFSSDDILYDGPFYHLMPEWSNRAGIFHEIGEKLIFLIIFLHVGALAYYYFKVKKNLVVPMVTGKAKSATGIGGALSRRKTIFGLVLMAALVALAQSATQLRPDYF